MLKIFISSTYRDLQKERGELIERLDKVLDAAAMEKFIPHGDTPQEAAITELQKSDIVIFLISSYGSLLDKCTIEDCQAVCSMKSPHKRKISYTHCEYQCAVAERKPHKLYRVESSLKDTTKIKRKFKKFTKKIEKEFYRKIVKGPEDIQVITEHLFANISKWYLENRIQLKDFCGRRKELKELLEKMEKGSVEVYGVGGIGKTTLVHVALLLQILRGKKVISLTREPSYTTASGEKRREITGSGYIHFKRKVKEHEIGEKITLSDVLDALKAPDTIRIEKEEKRISYILHKIKNEDTILFIDDFHLADTHVAELLKSSQNVVAASRKKGGYALQELHIKGVDDVDGFIDLVSDGTVTGEAREKIRKVAEGHPVSTIILVKNYQKINFTALDRFQQGLDVSTQHAEEFLRRVIKEVLSDEALEMLQVFAVLNPRLSSNIDVDLLEEVCKISNFHEIFHELTDTCMIEKREEGIYRFCFHHIRDSLVDDDERRHQITWEYYLRKVEKYGRNEDLVEVLYHEMKMGWILQSIDDLLDLCGKISVNQRDSFLRLIEVAEELRIYVDGEDRGVVLGTLGNLYRNLRKFDEAENAYADALKIYKKLAEENPDAYLPDLAMTQNNLGNLYSDLRKFDEAENAYADALKIYKKLAEENPDAYLFDLLQTQADIGTLYISTNRVEKGVGILKEFVESRNLPPDLKASYLADLAKGYETLGDQKAAYSYLLASANYFILHTRGVHCLGDVLTYLDKATTLGDESLKGDAILMKIAIETLSNKQKDVKIPETSYSRRGEAIIEAFKGNKLKFNPEDEVDEMALTLAEDIMLSSKK